MCAAAPQARVGLVVVVVAPVPAARQVARTGATVVGRRTRKCHVRHQPWRQRCVAGARSVWPRRFQLLCRGFCRRGSVRARHDRHRVTDCVRGLAQHAGRRCQRLTTRCCCWPRRVRNAGCLPSPRGVVLTVASASADFQGAYLTLPEVRGGSRGSPVVHVNAAASTWSQALQPYGRADAAPALAGSRNGGCSARC